MGGIRDKACERPRSTTRVAPGSRPAPGSGGPARGTFVGGVGPYDFGRGSGAFNGFYFYVPYATNVGFIRR